MENNIIVQSIRNTQNYNISFLKFFVLGILLGFKLIQLIIVINHLDFQNNHEVYYLLSLLFAYFFSKIILSFYYKKATVDQEGLKLYKDSENVNHSYLYDKIIKNNKTEYDIYSLDKITSNLFDERPIVKTYFKYVSNDIAEEIDLPNKSLNYYITNAYDIEKAFMENIINKKPELTISPKTLEYYNLNNPTVNL